jgi:hypothetical protein
MLHTATLAGECSTTQLVAATSRTLLKCSDVTGSLLGMCPLNSTLLLLVDENVAAVAVFDLLV